MDAGGEIQGVSVNSAPGLSLEALTASDPRTGYPGIPHNQVGVTTVDAIRKIGGEVEPKPTPANVNHATLSGLTPQQASDLFRPTLKNPSQQKQQ